MTEEERDYTAEASEQGWTPKENWKGPDDKWTDAQTFVERGEKIAGILKSKVERLEGKVEHLTESNKQFGEYHKKTLETQKRQNAERIEALEAQLAQSITDGDGQAYTKTRREIDGLKSEQAPTDDAQAWNQMAQEWASENRWYGENRKLARYADGISDEIKAEGYYGKSYFKELTRRVKEDFPDEFTNPKKSAPTGVEDGGEKGTSDSKARSYANLPADAKRACDDFVKQGFMTKEDYVKQFEFE